MAGSDRTNHALLVALCHPLRRRILRLMPEGGEESISPRDLAVQLDEKLTHVSYHVRVLARCGTARPVHTKKVNGTVTQRFYRRTIKADWARDMLAKPDSQPPDPEP